ncbi:MAG: LptF/LptG family permease [Flavobacteriales bacterium]
MKKISVLLLKSYIGPFIVTFIVAMFIFEMQTIWLYLDELVGKGLGVWVIFKLLIFASARIVNMALPLAILMSSIMTFGALSENNELTAMKSAGFSLFKIMRPLIIFSLFLSMGAFIFANNIWPIANLKFRTMLFSIMQQRPAFNLQDGVFYGGIDGISIRVSKKDEKTGELFDVLIYDHREKGKGNRTVIRAEKGIMQQTDDKRFLVLTLYNGVSYDEQTEKKKRDTRLQNFPMVSGSFKESIIRLDMSAFEFQKGDEEVYEHSYEMMSASQLDDAIDSLETRMDSVQIKLAEANLKGFHYMRDAKAGPVNAPWFTETLSPQDLRRAVINAKEMTKRMKDTVSRQEEELYNRERFITRHKIEWHRKFFLAVVCLVLFFIGAPLGAIIRKGGLGLPTIIALGLFIFYQLLTIAGEKMTKSLIIEPWFGMWMSTAILMPLSIWLTYKASKEATLVDKESYIKFFNRILVFLRIKKPIQS